MFIFLIVLALIVCVLLVLIVLVQNPKGGGLSSNFGGANQVIGVQRTGDFLEKTTWGLAIALIVICLSFSIIKPGTNAEGESNVNEDIQEQIDNSAAPAQPAAPMPAAPATK